MEQIPKNKLVDVSHAITLIREGKVGVMPTDTVYGLVASAHNQQAVERLYSLKSREKKPGTLIAASIDQLRELEVPDGLLALTVNLWPNPLSIILSVGEQYAYLHQGVGTIAIRVVDDATTSRILEQAGPLLTSSANQPGEPGSVTINEAWNYFKDSVDFYVDDGDRSGRVPSTIIQLLDDGEVDVIREGAVKI